MKHATTFGLMLGLLTIAYSSLAQSTSLTGLPQFKISIGEAVCTSVETVTNDIITSKPIKQTSVVHIEFSAAKAAEFRQFTHDHLKQEVQILVGTNVVSTPIIQSEIPSRKIYFNFSTPEEAKKIADYLSRKP